MRRPLVYGVPAVVLLAALVSHVSAQSPRWLLPDETAADRALSAYFEHETERLESIAATDVPDLATWQERREQLRHELFDMLGLVPLPERTDLKAEVTAITEQDDFVVERLHFQSRPGLYVTANLYRPVEVEEPLPAILYLCGHGRVAADGVSFGNKVHYEHHGAWFARNGYVCLSIDSLQLGEIEAIHHGTYRYDMWWWLNRGYTPAGVEAWNCIRALDYLQSRPEVDGSRLGATGRSGGGAYSWWIAALDERIKAAVPVAGITDLRNHVVDGCVEGHCDCMYFLNTYEWDYPTVAALVAPRPLLISNTDRDSIFPLDGVVRTHRAVRHIYELYEEPEQLALHITAGPHQDTQELRVHAFRWFNQHLKGSDGLIEEPAVKFFEPEELQVFADGLPDDERNTRAHDWFVGAADASRPPEDAEEWNRWTASWRDQLEERVFRGWPDDPPDIDAALASPAIEHQGLLWSRFTYQSQDHVKLTALVVSDPRNVTPRALVVHVPDQPSWQFLQGVLPESWSGVEPPEEADASGDATDASSTGAEDVDDGTYEAWWTSVLGHVTSEPIAYVILPPRGIGPTAWSGDERKHVQIRRRFYLIGQSLEGMRVWDIRRGLQGLRAVYGDLPIDLHARGTQAANTLYASLFERPVRRLELVAMPATHADGPFYLNVGRVFDVPQAAAMAAERSPLHLYHAEPADWQFVQLVSDRLGWEGRIELVDSDRESPAAIPAAEGRRP